MLQGFYGNQGLIPGRSALSPPGPACSPFLPGGLWDKDPAGHILPLRSGGPPPPARGPAGSQGARGPRSQAPSGPKMENCVSPRRETASRLLNLCKSLKKKKKSLKLPEPRLERGFGCCLSLQHARPARGRRSPQCGCSPLDSCARFLTRLPLGQAAGGAPPLSPRGQITRKCQGNVRVSAGTGNALPYSGRLCCGPQAAHIYAPLAGAQQPFCAVASSSQARAHLPPRFVATPFASVLQLLKTHVHTPTRPQVTAKLSKVQCVGTETQG